MTEGFQSVEPLEQADEEIKPEIRKAVALHQTAIFRHTINRIRTGAYWKQTRNN